MKTFAQNKPTAKKTLDMRRNQNPIIIQPGTQQFDKSPEMNIRKILFILKQKINREACILNTQEKVMPTHACTNKITDEKCSLGRSFHVHNEVN